MRNEGRFPGVGVPAMFVVVMFEDAYAGVFVKSYLVLFNPAITGFVVMTILSAFSTVQEKVTGLLEPIPELGALEVNEVMEGAGND